MSETEHYTEDEFDEKLAELLGRMDDLEARAEARGITVSDTDEDDELAAYGTGIQLGPGETELTGTTEPSDAAKRARKRVQAAQSDDPADYSTGVHGWQDPDLEDELTAASREDAPTPASTSGEDDDLPPEAYGTGIEGDTTRREYLKEQAREEQAEILADAIAKAENRKEED